MTIHRGCGDHSRCGSARHAVEVGLKHDQWNDYRVQFKLN